MAIIDLDDILQNFISLFITSPLLAQFIISTSAYIELFFNVYSIIIKYESQPHYALL